MTGPVSASPVDPLTALYPTLACHLVNTLGWTELRPLQRAALDPVLGGGDALLQPHGRPSTERAFEALDQLIDAVLIFSPAVLGNLVAPGRGSGV